MKTIYDVDYFIAKFEAIPESNIGTSQDTGCAYGQCRSEYHGDGSESPEGKSLQKLLMSLLPLTPTPCAAYSPHLGTPARINNGEVKEYQQRTPKQRLLAALYDVKKRQQPEVKECIVYVTVDEKVRELQAETLIEN